MIHLEVNDDGNKEDTCGEEALDCHHSYTNSGGGKF